MLQFFLLLLLYIITQKDDFQSKSSLHGHAGMHFGVNGWSPKIDMDIFKKPENQRAFLGYKISKTLFFSQSRVYMIMHGCILMLRFCAQKSIQTFLKSRKTAQYSQIVFFVQNVFKTIKGCFSVIGVVFSKMILAYLKSPKIARNSGVVNTAEKVFLKIKGCFLVIGVI